MYTLTLDRANLLLDTLLRENDAENAAELFELIYGLAPRDNLIALELQKRLFARIENSGFQSAFDNFRDGFNDQQFASAA